MKNKSTDCDAALSPWTVWSFSYVSKNTEQYIRLWVFLHLTYLHTTT